MKYAHVKKKNSIHPIVLLFKDGNLISSFYFPKTDHCNVVIFNFAVKPRSFIDCGDF